MKKKALQLNRKLVLQKNDIVALNNKRQTELMGGVTATGCPSVACPTNVSCNVACNSQVACATVQTRGCGCISYQPVSTPACQVC